MAYQVAGTTQHDLGEVVPSRKFLERGVDYHDAQKHHSSAWFFGQDAGVTCLAALSWTLWYLGYPDQALKRSQESVELARSLEHPFTLVFALFYATELHRLRGELETVCSLAEEVISRSEKFPLWLGLGNLFRGWALMEMGQRDEGIRQQIRQCAEDWQATGARRGLTIILALLAETEWKMGQTKEGLNLLDKALTVVEDSEVRWYEAELHRLKGDLLLSDSMKDQDEAQACFRKAIQIARDQQAKSLELRAAIRLSRLLKQQGQSEEARQMLQEIYNWFTEGFDTADLKEAKTLIEELS